jgi:iron complex outermembrane receptor protein
MKTILLFLFLFCVGFDSYSQTLSGKIADSHQQPIPGATLKLKPIGLVTISESDGSFSFPSVQPGSYSLQVSFVGFSTQQRSIILSGEPQDNLVFILEESSSDLQTVEVFGRKETDYKSDYNFASTKIETRTIDVPQSITTVTKELIKDQNIYRLNEAVKNVAGVNQFSVYDDITMRGFRNSDYRLINGMRYYANFWSSPLLINIERVEFIKGPSSALFSNSNPGGTINMVTKKPLEETLVAMDFSVGSFNTLRTTADFSGKVNGNDQVLYRLNVGYENAGSFRDFIGFNTFAVAPSVTFKASERTVVNFDMSYTDYNTQLDRGRPTFQNDENLLSTPLNFNLNQPGDFLRDKIFSGTISLRHQLNEAISFNASYMKFVDDQQLREHGFNGYITSDSIGLYFNERYRYQTADNFSAFLTANFKTGAVSHTGLLGWDYIMLFDRNNEWYANEDQVGGFSLTNPFYFNRNIGNYIPITDEWSYYESQYQTSGVYLQDLMKYKKLQVLIGFRYDSFRVPTNSWQFRSTGLVEDDTQRALLPRIGVVYSLKTDLNVYGTFNQGYQPVDPISNSNPRFGGPFDPQYSQLLEVGLKSQNFENKLLTTISLYQITVDNVLVNANNPQNPDLLIQRGQERARGVEIETVGRITPNLSVMANYSFNNALITQSDDESLIGLVKENAPQHISSTWLKYVIDRGKLDGLGFGFGHSQVSERRTFDTYTDTGEYLMLPRYMVLNALVSYSTQRFTIGANINNLANETHWIGGYNFQRNFPGAPRNYLVKISYNL